VHVVTVVLSVLAWFGFAFAYSAMNGFVSMFSLRCFVIFLTLDDDDDDDDDEQVDPSNFYGVAAEVTKKKKPQTNTMKYLLNPRIRQYTRRCASHKHG
jgi:hypothetical protein